MDNSHYDHILFQERLRAAEGEADYKLFSMLRPRLIIDGNQWCCLFGEDLQSGIAGFGNTPFEAIRNWNAEWHRPIKAAKGEA